MAKKKEEAQEPKVIEGLTEGRIVHYVLDKGLGDRGEEGEHRPAIIVKVWDHGMGTSNLQVFTDGLNDGHPHDQGTVWKTSIQYSEEKEPGTWHFIEPA